MPTEIQTVDDDLAGYFNAEELLIAKMDTVTWEDVRRALEGISGTLSETVLEQRQER